MQKGNYSDVFFSEVSSLLSATDAGGQNVHQFISKMTSEMKPFQCGHKKGKNFNTKVFSARQLRISPQNEKT